MRFWRPGATKWDRALAITLVAGLAMLLLIGLVFAIAYGSQRITRDATSLHKADEVLRSATVIRAQLSLGSHAGRVDQEFGSNSAEAIAVAMTEASTALDDLQVGVTALQNDQPEHMEQVDPATTTFVAAASEALQLLADGEYEQAQEVVSGELTESFEQVVDGLVVIRDDLASSVASSDLLLGQIGNVARFLVAFVIPAAVILIYRDLLRRQHRQQELEGRLEAERQISAAREEFIANASHELRTPLTSITGLAMLLEENPAIREDDASAELLDLMISESGDLNRMVEDLLTAARLDAGALSYTFTDVDPVIEAKEVAESFQRAGSPVAVECVPAVLRVDPVRLRQILRNLLSNANKYGGPSLRIEGYVEGRTYVYEVIDDGIGVPSEIAERLFERFVHQGQATAVRGSVGLGLSIVHALSQGMGGSVTYRRDNQETHFSVRLPLASAESPDSELLADLVGTDVEG